MSIDIFLNKYVSLSSDKAKQLIIDSIIKTDVYINYEEKIKSCNYIIKNSTKNLNGTIIYNTPKEYFLYIIQLFKMYTNLNFDVENKDILYYFNEFNKRAIIDQLINGIKEKNKYDFSYYDIIFKMVKDDFFLNNKGKIADILMTTDDIKNDLLCF